MKIDQAHRCPFCLSTDLLYSEAVLMPFVASRALGYAPISIDESWGLRDVPSGVTYMPCKTMACTSCNGLFLDIRFTEGQMQRLYKDYRTEPYNMERSLYEPGYMERYQDLEIPQSYILAKQQFISTHTKLSGGFSLLDWGANTAQTTPFNANPDVKVVAYDISGQAEYSDLSELPNEFDIICSSHVLEHVPFPIDELSLMRKFIKPNGFIYIELPLERIMANELQMHEKLRQKRHWHEHINFFSQLSIESCLRKAGFSPIAIERRSPPAPGNFSEVFFVLAQKD